MAKVKFKFKGEVTLAEVPDYLKMIDDLTNRIAELELEKRRGYSKEEFFTKWMAEEDDTPSDQAYDYLIDELTKVYCKLTNSSYDKTIVTGLFKLDKKDIKEGIDIKAEVDSLDEPILN
jgi:hypothetical protein